MSAQEKYLCQRQQMSAICSGIHVAWYHGDNDLSSDAMHVTCSTDSRMSDTNSFVTYHKTAVHSCKVSPLTPIHSCELKLRTCML